MRVGVIGINHKLANLKLREQLAKVCQTRFSPGNSLHGDHVFVLLSTCNRTEIYFYSEDLAETHSYLLSILRQDVDDDFDQKLYSYFGFDCFQHLSRVTAGLDSAIAGETEIQGQVKTAYENALNYATLPHDLHFLFQKSLMIGKKIRTELPLKPGLPDLEDAIHNTGLRFFKDPKEARILFVGTSEINMKVINFLKNKKCSNITICNRNAESQSRASNLGISWLDWKHFSQCLDYDWIIFGTKSPEYLLKQEYVQGQSHSQKLIIDLCVPRNVDPALAYDQRITLFNIDQLNRMLKNRRERMDEIFTKAENLVSQTIHQYSVIFSQRQHQRLQFAAGA